MDKSQSNKDGAVKPPLGIKPRFLWEIHHPHCSKWKIRLRIKLIQQAQERYVDAGSIPPKVWQQEIDDRLLQLKPITNKLNEK